MTLAERRIAFLTEPSQRADGAGLFWLSGFHSVMTSTKVTFLAEYAREHLLGMTRFDYSGHGLSDGDIADGVLSDWLEEAWAIFTQIAKGPQVMIGSSMGGWLALLLVKRMQAEGLEVTQRFRGLVLIAPAWDMTERLMWSRFTDEIKAVLAREGVWDRPSRYGDGPYPITQRLIDDGRRHLIAGEAPLDIPVPVHILHGLKDPDVPWEGSVQLIKMMPDAEKHLHLIEDGEHRLSRESDLAALVRAIEAVLDD